MIIQDVVIIGSGAAGSTAAFHLAKEGRNVILLEKNEKGYIKPCGGGISSSTQQLFPFDLKPIIEEVINKVHFTWNLEDEVIANLPGSSPFWIVKREKFDELIISKAISAGAKLIQPFFVRSVNKEDSIWKIKSAEGITLLAKSIIIADGSYSPWPSLFKLGPTYKHKAKTTSIRLSERGNIERGVARFDFGLVRNGFTWAFPINEGVNIGVGTFIGNNSIDNEKVLKSFLISLGLNPDTSKRTNQSLNVWNGHHKLHGEGLLIVGDAASLCDPFLAEGLRPALISGYEAAKCLNKWLLLESKDLQEYTKKIKTKWGNSMAWARRIAQVFYRFPYMGYQLGIKRPTAPKRIAQILSGDLGYEDIAQRSIKRLLLKKG